MNKTLNIPFNDPSVNLVSTPADQAAPGVEPGQARDIPAASANLEINATEIIDSNPEPFKVRVKNSGKKRGIIAGLLRIANKALKPRELLPEEIALLEEEKQRQLQEKVLIAESQACVGRIISTLTRLGICYIPRRDGQKDPWRNGPKKVRVQDVVAEPDSIWFKLDLGRLPHGVSVEQLTTQEVLNNLMYSLGHKVSVQASEAAGVWYIMERASGSLGLPTHVMYKTMIERMPASADALTIPIGMGANSKPVYASLGRMCHMLVAGTTNMGKSNFLNSLLCSLIRQNTPDRLQLVLIDLKNGIEFSHYEGLPHLLKLDNILLGHDEDGEEVRFSTNGIVYDLEDVPETLLWLAREADKRFTLLRESKAKNIGEYNARRRKNAMSHVVVVIDEYANIAYSEYGKRVEKALVRAAAMWRAIGIHLIVCTQIPKTEIITNPIKGNLPAKIGFYCSNNAQSMTILDSGSAHAMGLVPGRLVFSFEREIIAQAPLINNDLIAATVQGAINGEFGALTGETDVTMIEIITWALDNNQGWLNIAAVFAKFRERQLKRATLETWLKEAEGQTFVIGSTAYMVTPGDNNHARRAVPVKENEETE